MTVRELLVSFGLKVDGASFKAGDAAADRAKGRLEAIKKASDLAGKALKVMAVGAAAAFVGLGVAAAKVGGEFESLRASLKTVTGSTEAGAAAFKKIQAFAASTPFSVKEITTAFVKLKALGLDPSERALKSYGNTSSAMGKSLNDMIEAVADASTGEFERLKEFGIKASSQGDQVAFTFQGVTTTVGKNAEEIQKYLLAIGETKFAGAMDDQAKTFNGVMSNLGDALDSFLDQVAQNGLLDALKEVGREMGAMSAGGDGLAKTLGKALGDAVRGLWDAFKRFIPQIPHLVDQFSKLVGVVFRVVDIVSRVIDAVGGPEGLIYLLVGLKATLGGVSMAMGAMNAATTMGAAGLAKMGLAFGAMAVAAAGAVAIISHFNDKLAESRKHFDSAENASIDESQRAATAEALKGYSVDELRGYLPGATDKTRAQIEAEISRRGQDVARSTQGISDVIAGANQINSVATRRSASISRLHQLRKDSKRRRLAPSEKKEIAALQKELDISVKVGSGSGKSKSDFDQRGYDSAVDAYKSMGLAIPKNLRAVYTSKKEKEKHLTAQEQLEHDFGGGKGVAHGGKIVDRPGLGTTINRIENRYDPKVTITVQATQKHGEDGESFARRVAQIAQDTIDRVVLRPGYDHFTGISGA